MRSKIEPHKYYTPKQEDFVCAAAKDLIGIEGAFFVFSSTTAHNLCVV